MASPMFLLLVTILASIDQITPTTNVPSTNSYLSTANKIRLKKVIEPELKSKDLPAIYSAVIGYELLEEVVPNKAEICKNVLSLSSSGNITPEAAFYITSVWKSLKDCQGLSKDAITTALINIIEKDTSTIPELYYAVSALSKLSHKFSDVTIGKLTTALQNALNKDDNLWTLGYVFHIASHLGSAGSFAFDRIEDAIIQADEVDGKFLQFEGGLHITSHIINGIYKLSMSLNKKPPLKPHQSVKLANYLLSRRSVQTPKGVVNLLSALTILSTSKFENLVCITTTESGHIVSEEQPFISLKVCDILGKPLSTAPKVVATSAHIVEDGEVNLAVKDCKPSSTDKTLFTYDFMKSEPVRGFYKVSFMADTVTNTITAKVLSKITLGYLEIGTGDADQTTQPKLTKVSYPEKYQTKIEADSQQKLVLKFLLKDAVTSKPVRVHQAFVRLSPVDSNANTHKRDHEIIFVAEADAANVYKFEMPVGSSASNFGHKSGDYDLELIVGDAILSNPFQWTICTVSLKFPAQTSVEAASHSVSYKQKPNVYTTKPEIRHMFREPEKRPPAFVSNLFTGLCLAPALLLLILWAKLGVNISNFPLSLSAVLFHLGLGSIFVLFGVFWLKLNMFVTLRYLLGLGVVTFLAGNKLLTHVARKHKALR